MKQRYWTTPADQWAAQVPIGSGRDFDLCCHRRCGALKRSMDRWRWLPRRQPRLRLLFRANHHVRTRSSISGHELRSACSAECGLARERSNFFRYLMRRPRVCQTSLCWRCKPPLEFSAVKATCHSTDVSTDSCFSDILCSILGFQRPAVASRRRRYPLWYLGAREHLSIGDRLALPSVRSQNSEYYRGTEYRGYLPVGSSTRSDNSAIERLYLKRPDNIGDSSQTPPNYLGQGGTCPTTLTSKKGFARTTPGRLRICVTGVDTNPASIAHITRFFALTYR